MDLGAEHNYRYVNASNVYAKGKADGVTTHAATYTYASGSNGNTVDLGINHSYRYVNASNVFAQGYAQGKADGSAVVTGAIVIGAEKTTKTFTVPAGTYYFAAVATCHHSNVNRARSSITVNGSTIISCAPNEVDKGVNASTTMALAEGAIVSISANYVSNQEGVSAAGFYRVGN